MQEEIGKGENIVLKLSRKEKYWVCTECEKEGITQNAIFDLMEYA